MIHHLPVKPARVSLPDAMTHQGPGISTSRVAAPRDSRDLREGGRWTFWQELKNTILYRLVRMLLWLVDSLPEAQLLELGRFLGHSWYVFDARARARALGRAKHCRQLFCAPSTVRQSFICAGENLALCLLLRRPGVCAQAFVSVSEAAARTLAGPVARRPTIVVSAHLGPFEMLAARVAELGLRPAVVVRESYDVRLDPLVDQHRLVQGVSVIHRGKPGATARVLRALRAGQPVGFLIDLESRVRSTSLPFLGKPATMIPLGPQLLSRLTGARLLVSTLARRSSVEEARPHFELKVRPVRAAEHLGDNVALLTQRVISQLEREILRHPEDWLWMA